MTLGDFVAAIIMITTGNHATEERPFTKRENAVVFRMIILMADSNQDVCLNEAK